MGLCCMGCPPPCPPMAAMGWGKLCGPPGPPPCIPWYGRLSDGVEFIQGGRLGGGCPPWRCAVDRGLLVWAALGADTGASPSSAIRDRYSLSIRALS